MAFSPLSSPLRTLSYQLAMALSLVFYGVSASAQTVPVQGRTLTELAADLSAGRISSALLVKTYLARIAAIDRAGPGLHAVLSLNPNALKEAIALDAERKAGHLRGPLHGIPILVKDNIETKDPIATTAGSLALAQNITGRDSPLVANLRAAGVIILGKTNLSEWANLRSTRPISGWSGIGGFTHNPYVLNRSACGSSSGSGAAVAASLAAAAIGSETDGSVTCPASMNGVIGIKPTLGLVSRTHIVPISHTQDTAGPLAASVRDAAELLSVMAGSDPADPATVDADAHKADYAKMLDANSLRGTRIGVMRFLAGFHPETDAVFARALQTLKSAGATLVEIDSLPGYETIANAELTVMTTELKTDLNAYLATTPATVKSRTLADLIAFNQAHADRELALFGQELFIKAQATKGFADPAYIAAYTANKKLAGPQGIDKFIAADHLDALVAPTAGPAFVLDIANGDNNLGSTTTLAAIAGYPHVSVPMGAVYGLPVGLSIFGPAWSDGKMLSYAYAFEQTLKLHQHPQYLIDVKTNPPLKDLLLPVKR